MFKNLKTNVVWVDFKSKRVIDLSELGHPQKPTQPIPCLCQPKKQLIKGAFQ